MMCLYDLFCLKQTLKKKLKAVDLGCSAFALVDLRDGTTRTTSNCRGLIKVTLIRKQVILISICLKAGNLGCSIKVTLIYLCLKAGYYIDQYMSESRLLY